MCTYCSLAQNNPTLTTTTFFVFFFFSSHAVICANFMFLITPHPNISKRETLRWFTILCKISSLHTQVQDTYLGDGKKIKHPSWCFCSKHQSKKRLNKWMNKRITWNQHMCRQCKSLCTATAVHLDAKLSTVVLWRCVHTSFVPLIQASTIPHLHASQSQ